MKVKRFIANDIQEAMIKVKTELGRDAIILHTRKIRKPGLLGFFKKPFIEVVAAIDSEYNPQNKTNLNTKKNRASSKSFHSSEKNFDKEISSIKDMLDLVLNKLDNPLKEETQSNNIKTPVLLKFQNILTENEVNKQFVDKILNIIARQISISDKNEESIKNALKIAIKDFLGKPYTIENSEKKQRVFFFVGPTGVGKTTTLAKIAAKLSILDKKSVALITADTYRIAAVEQLKTYSEILDVPLSVIYEPMEIEKVIEKYKDKSYILVDTAGRNHNHIELLDELKNIISYVENPEVFLLISLTTGHKDIINIIKSYEFLDNYRIIFTKMDEASTLGNIINVKMLTSKQLSYITTGQSVPDDIEVANIDKIVDSIVGE